MEMCGLSVSLVSFCEFETVSDIKVKPMFWSSRQEQSGDGCERDREWLKDWAAFCATGTQASGSQLCLFAPPNTKQTPEAGGESLKPWQASNSHRSREFLKWVLWTWRLEDLILAELQSRGATLAKLKINNLRTLELWVHCVSFRRASWKGSGNDIENFFPLQVIQIKKTLL